MKEYSLHMTYEEAVDWQKNWKAPRWEDCKNGENGKPCWVCQKVIDSKEFKNE
jgi:hypothetical protein